MEEILRVEIYDKAEMTKLLRMADSDKNLAGFVFPEDQTKARLPIFSEARLVGFATPRQDGDGVWRMGAIFIAAEYRNLGLARTTIANFMRGKRGRAFIEDINLASMKAYRAAGFHSARRSENGSGTWWENF